MCFGLFLCGMREGNASSKELEICSIKTITISIKSCDNLVEMATGGSRCVSLSSITLPIAVED